MGTRGSNQVVAEPVSGSLPDHELLEAARQAARAGAEVHRRMAGRIGESEWEEKGPADFVTAVDLDAEQRILDLLRDRFPGHGFLAEEATDEARGAAGAEARGPEKGPESGASPENGPEGAPSRGRPGTPGAPPVRWIVDPLDGTTNWLHGYPEYAVSIAAEDAGGLRVGVVLNSVNGELFEAVRGGGSRLDGEPIQVSSVRSLRNALVGTGFPFKKTELLAPYLEVFSRVLLATSGIRRAGAAALDLCDVACGRLDAFFEYWLMPWDVAAGGLIVREAGGLFEPLPLPSSPHRIQQTPGGAATPSAAAASIAGEELTAGGFLAGNPHLMPGFRELVQRPHGARRGE